MTGEIDRFVETYEGLEHTRHIRNRLLGAVAGEVALSGVLALVTGSPELGMVVGAITTLPTGMAALDFQSGLANARLDLKNLISSRTHHFKQNPDKKGPFRPGEATDPL